MIKDCRLFSVLIKPYTVFCWRLKCNTPPTPKTTRVFQGLCVSPVLKKPTQVDTWAYKWWRSNPCMSHCLCWWHKKLGFDSNVWLWPLSSRCMPHPSMELFSSVLFDRNGLDGEIMVEISSELSGKQTNGLMKKWDFSKHPLWYIITVVKCWASLLEKNPGRLLEFNLTFPTAA